MHFHTPFIFKKFLYCFNGVRRIVVAIVRENHLRKMLKTSVPGRMVSIAPGKSYKEKKSIKRKGPI